MAWENKNQLKFMLILVAAIFAVFAAGVAIASEPFASIESTDLRQVPKAIRSAIETDVSFKTYRSLHCKTRGKEVPLSSDLSVGIWFVTTTEACGWGAALGPIWLVETRSVGETVLILATGGYSLSIAGKPRGRFAGIAVESGTAEGTVRNQYFFDGRKYIRNTK